MEQTINRFEHAAKIVLYILAVLLPIWFLPWPIGVELGRVITFDSLIILAAFLWFLSLLSGHKIRYQYSPLLYVFLIMLVVFGISTLFSSAPYLSMFIIDPASERFLTLVLGITLAVVASSVMRTKQEVGTALILLIFSSAVTGIISFLQLFFNISLFQYIISFAQGSAFNVVGTINSLTLFYAVMFLLSTGIVLISPRGAWKGWVQNLFYFSSIIFLINLLLVNLLTTWITLFVAGLFLLGLMLLGARGNIVEFREKFGWRYSLVLGFLALSLVLIMIRTPLVGGLSIPAEVSPSFSGTLNIARSAWKDGVKQALFGSGPGTFGLEWSRHKDPVVNQTPFWNIRFNQGFSWVSTLFATVGIIGSLSFLVFLLVAVFLFMKMLFVRLTASNSYNEHDLALALSTFLGFSALILISLLYPSNYTFVVLFFFLVGLLVVLFNEEKVEEGSAVTGEAVSGGGTESVRSFWGIKTHTYQLESPWSVFISSIVLILFLALGVGGFYREINRLRVAFVTQAGFNAFNKGDLDEAAKQFEQAVNFDDKDVVLYQNLVQIRMAKLRNLIQSASSGKNVQAEFQSVVTLAIQNSQRATDLDPKEPLVWEAQGALYEIILPFIPGAEGFSFKGYQMASELEPQDPTIYVEWGRALLTYADRLQLTINQTTKTADRDKFVEARTNVLKNATEVLQKAATAKSDLAQAHFLLSQVAIRLGNLQSAIQSTENAKLAAPSDIGVAFQLGLLYYQNSEFDKSQAEFERAISMNQNYSNARYFLGLIYDRKGEREKAISQFEEIQKLNLNNQEVQRILANLRAQRPALTGIVPPANPPEKRIEAPVK